MRVRVIVCRCAFRCKAKQTTKNERKKVARNMVFTLIMVLIPIKYSIVAAGGIPGTNR